MSLFLFIIKNRYSLPIWLAESEDAYKETATFFNFYDSLESPFLLKLILATLVLKIRLSESSSLKNVISVSSEVSKSCLNFYLIDSNFSSTSNFFF